MRRWRCADAVQPQKNIFRLFEKNKTEKKKRQVPRYVKLKSVPPPPPPFSQREHNPPPPPTLTKELALYAPMDKDGVETSSQRR